MSYGLMCLKCRRYINTPRQPVEAAWCCVCDTPRPSWDAKTDAPPETLERI